METEKINLIYVSTTSIRERRKPKKRSQAIMFFEELPSLHHDFCTSHSVDT